MGDMDAGGRELTGEIQALHSRIAKLEQVSHDSPKHKNVDEELDSAWREWETTFDAIKDSLILTDSEFTIIQANLAASQLFNRPLDQIVGRTCWQLVHGTNEAPEGCPLKRAKTTKIHEEIELYLPQNGIWAADSVDPVLDQQGRLTGVVHIIKDVTNRKRAEELLRRERDRAQKYLDIVGVMLLVIDAEQRVGLINKKGCEILGYSEEEVIAKNWFDNFIPKRMREDVEAVFKRIMNGEIKPLEYVEGYAVISKSGKEKFISWHNSLIRDEHGKIIGTLSSGEDITERKKAEEEVRKLAKFPEENPYPVLRIHRNGTVLFANKASEPLLNAKDSGIDRPAPREWHQLVKKALSSGQVIREETEHDGRVFAFRAVPIVDSDYVNFYEADITERKKAAEQLRETTQTLQAVIQASPLPIFAVDRERIVKTWNPAAERTFGWGAQEVIGRKFPAIPEEKMDEADALFSRALESGLTEVETLRQRKDGSLIDVSISAAPLRDSRGNINGVMAVLADITERKKMDEVLRESEEKYRGLVENSPNIVAIYQEGALKYVNQIMYEKLGWTFQEMTSPSFNPVEKIIPQRFQSLVKENIAKRLRGENIPPYEISIKTRDGSEIPVIVNAQAILYHGKPADEVIHTDITERKKAEQKLLEDQAKLKSLASQLTLAEEHERRRLATELHDRISQSLVISKIKLDALCKSGHSRKLDKALEEVCNSLGQTIQDTRTLTFDLGNPVLYELGFEAAVSEWLTEQIQKKHGLTAEFEDDREDKPLDDDVRILLFRDVRELLINVVKHAGAHKVKVSVRKLDNICVTVEDDGVGFDPAEVLAGAARRGEFGLFSIRERLEDLGSHLQIDSAPGRGCKITMTAPLKRR